MLYRLATCAIILLVPMLAQAQGYSSSASANSGGNSVGAGGVIRTGAESSSVQVTNISGENSSSFYIKTDINGEVHEETIEDASGHIEVSVQASPGAGAVEIKKGSPATMVKKIQQASAPTPVSTSSAQTAAAAISIEASSTQPLQATGIVAQIFSWLGNLFSFWQ